MLFKTFGNHFPREGSYVLAIQLYVHRSPESFKMADAKESRSATPGEVSQALSQAILIIKNKKSSHPGLIHNFSQFETPTQLCTRKPVHAKINK